MRHWIWTTIACAAVALTLTACEVEQTEEGELPEVEAEGDVGELPEYDIETEEEGEMPDLDMDVEEGNMPEYDVETPEVEVEQETATVPDVDVDVDEEVIEVPDVDVDMPEDDAEEEMEEEMAGAEEQM